MFTFSMNMTSQGENPRERPRPRQRQFFFLIGITYYVKAAVPTPDRYDLPEDWKSKSKREKQNCYLSHS
jgi:hypothetical protein